ncbi:polymorphic toxin type 44 domain-containing protein [Nocardia sp. NPDC058658]|uniref:polymorphic toxin type 44 domain-containing protein n=1 Tax=Nocardia sp. NPDC058658 TaxID=3346580 RepID=UPI003647C76F
MSWDYPTHSLNNLAQSNEKYRRYLSDMLVEQDDLAESWSGAGAEAAASRVVSETTAGNHIANQVDVLRTVLTTGIQDIFTAGSTATTKAKHFEGQGFEVDDRGIVTANAKIRDLHRAGTTPAATTAGLELMAEAGRYTLELLAALQHAADTATAVSAAARTEIAILSGLIQRESPTKADRPPLLNFVDIGNTSLSEFRFTETEKYIYDEMMTNLASKDVSDMSELNEDRHWYELLTQNPDARHLAAKAEFMNLVQTGGDWDHKWQLQQKFGLETGEDFYFKDPSQDKAVSYDIYSNIHYGYVGRASGFDTDTLISFANLGDGVTGTNDSGDDISMNIGAALYDKYGANMTQAQLHAGVQEAMQQMEAGVMNGEEITQIRRTK